MFENRIVENKLNNNENKIKEFQLLFMEIKAIVMLRLTAINALPLFK